MSLLFAELTATCNALGYAVAGKTKYLLDNECKEAVRELIRFLRRDDETHEIRRYLGTAKILEKDLVPILIHRHSNEEILDLLLRLLVNLTTPTLLLYNEEVPTERTARQYYQSIVKSLQTYKQAFVDKNLWAVLSEKLTSLLALEWSDRGEEKSLIIVRILILVRNILHIPVDTDTERRPDNDASIHDQVLWALHEGEMINLILYIAASENEQQYYFHVLEIISLMLRDQNAETLASSSLQRSDEEKQRDLQELMAVRKKEVEDRQKKMKKHIAARHSRFGGTFVVKGVKSISDNDLVVHSLNNQITSSFDTKKHKLKTPKNRAPMQCDSVERRSAFSVRVLMKEFCVEFLNGAYNGLMRYIREMLARGKAQSNDESYYFWAMRFFMQFNRCYKFEVKLISETMSIQIFHFIQERLEDWRANLIIDKKKIYLWSKRMHLALKAYQELLNTLMKMYQSQDKGVRDSSHTIMSNIFYIVEYRELLMSLLNLFDEIKFSKEYLKDLIESNHVFMKMLEHYCKRHRALVVQNKPKAVRRKKKSKKSAKQTKDLTAECTEEKWNEMESKISDIIEKRDELTVQSLPFDAASDVPFEEQKVEAMRRIRLFLVKGDTEEAIGLFRACREVWPENDCFGSASMSSSEECAALKEIFSADIGFPTAATEINEPSEEESEDESENEEAMAVNIQVNEQSFQFDDFMKKFAKQKIVYACCLLLGQFEKNTPFTNHCVCKLLHRIAFDCKYSSILFQASVFRTFQRILDSTEEQHKELQKFAVFIVRKFIEVAKKNDKVYMELLFWKGHKEAYEIEEGYGSLASANSGKVAWTEEQEDELRRLSAEYENDKPSEDMVDWIHRNLIDQSRSRKSLMKKLRELYLIVGPQKRKSSSSRPPREFSEAEVAQITQLFNEFREAYDVIGCIMERLDIQRPKKRIVDKILELGLVQDRRELRKKKTTTSNKSNPIVEDSSSDDSDESSDDDERDNRTVAKQVNMAHCLVSSDVISSTKTVLNLGMKEALDWIETSLNEVLEELGDDEEDVPILPLADYSIKAIDDKDFQTFLKAIGIKPPADSQETYWRIPGTWQANDIRKRIYLMKMAENGGENVEDGNTMNNNLQIDSDLEDNPRLEIDASPSSHVSNDSIDHSGNLDTPHVDAPEVPESSSNGNAATVSKKRKLFNVEEFLNRTEQQKVKKKKVRRNVDNDDDDDDNRTEAIDVDPTSNETGSRKKIKKRKIQRIVDDDDDMNGSQVDDIIEEQSSSMNNKSKNRTQRKKDRKKISKILEDDDDSDDLLSKPRKSDDDSSSSDDDNYNSHQLAKKKKVQPIVDDDDDNDDIQRDVETSRKPISIDLSSDDEVPDSSQSVSKDEQVRKVDNTRNDERDEGIKTTDGDDPSPSSNGIRDDSSQPKIKKKKIQRIVDDDDSENDEIVDTNNEVSSSIDVDKSSPKKNSISLIDSDSDTENVSTKPKKSVSLAYSDDSDAEMLSAPFKKSGGLESDSE
ncbi:protein timeless homolog [Planococcus citri]|uniref:protein timeless homolog n=1 Tax=Planococcus citri TaxID=170843 RepID=UPI0031F9EC50